MAKKTRSNSGSDKGIRGVDLVEVERLLEFMQKHRLEQFEYERDGIHVMLKRASTPSQGEVRRAPAYETVGEDAASEPGVVPVPSAGPSAKSVATKVASEDLHVIKSPIVGTFYAAASPGAEPFVNVGTQVESGQVLCIIEAMKLMNEIEADTAGEVMKIFAENGQPVEYGQPLFGIRIDRKK